MPIDPRPSIETALQTRKATEREANAKYYARTSDRIILRYFELRPSTIAELIDCLRDQNPHPADKRIERLRQLYFNIMGEDPTTPAAETLVAD